MTMMNGAANPDTIVIDEWVVVITAGGQQYLGRVASGDEFTALVNGECTELSCAFEFMTPTSMSAEGMNRGVVVMPVGLTGHPTPLHVTPVAAYTCTAMAEADKQIHKNIVQKGFEMLAQFRASRSAGAAAQAKSSLLVKP